jgi:hypothetical protein
VATLIDYAELVDTVRELIDGTGREVTFKKLGSAVADSTQPWKPSGSTTEQDAYATFVPLSSLNELGLLIEDEELFRKASEACLVAPNASVDLTLFTMIEDDGVDWRIEWVKVLKPGDTVLLMAFGVAR